MTSTTVHNAPTRTRHSWTPFELLLLAPFGLLLWYVETQPLVLPKAMPAPEPVAAAPAAEQDPDAPAFVVGGESTVDRRIAPVARVVLEGTDAPPSVEPAPATPPVAEAAQPAAAAPAASAAPVAPAASRARIEITDGTGVDGLAQDVAAALEQAGIAVAKTANMPSGSQRRTVIFYRNGFEGEARRLSLVFAQPPALVNNTRPHNGMDDYDVRLVLGSAAARDKALLARKGG